MDGLELKPALPSFLWNLCQRRSNGSFFRDERNRMTRGSNSTTAIDAARMAAIRAIASLVESQNPQPSPANRLDCLRESNAITQLFQPRCSKSKVFLVFSSHSKSNICL